MNVSSSFVFTLWCMVSNRMRTSGTEFLVEISKDNKGRRRDTEVLNSFEDAVPEVHNAFGTMFVVW